ncbi:cytochrome P450 [Mollisia scopiformis]|uniref:Cytochrome P450 n=1 Tax=Mollisia scopiformis TaxID=149040 RepID=A0A194WTS3_MOLSC|nr:cytochrome P450 [Mollisia scopiformis]KUJ11089.1 cytochrome P450 [Mollisia scopiformis]
MSNAVIVTALGGIGATYIFFWALLYLTQDSKEPPIVSSSIPFISPILGMIRWSMDFYPHMRKRHSNLPIYTLRIPGVRIYVINSLDLIPVVQRQWRTLIFAPISVKAVQAAMGASKEAVAVLEHDLVTEHGFVNGMAKATHSTMSKGSALDGLSSKTFEAFDEALNRFAVPTTVNMYEWVGKQIMRATTDAVYGPANPMRDAQNLKAWHKTSLTDISHQQISPALMFMMLDILPQNLFFKAAVQAREKLVKSFAKYYADGSYKQGSSYIQQFVQHCIEQKIPQQDIPRFLLGTVFNNVANTILTAFWVVFRIFSDPIVLEDCRNEVLQAVQDQDGISTIDLSFILNSCPVLLSTYHEVFRYHGMANSVRVVSEDHMLDNKYLLKKGNLIMMSARAQHSNSAIWGENVDEFYHKRFLKNGKRFSPVAFRGFGGGTTLCPGRHFATSEILLLATSLLLRFDVRPTKGIWVKPSTAKSSQAEAMEQPDDDIEVEFVPSSGARDKKWCVAFSGPRADPLLAQK